jgi:hypothetical protein
VPKGQVSWPVPLPSTAPCSSLLSTASSSSLLSPSLSIVVPVVSPQASAPPEVTPLPIAPLFPSFVSASEHFRDVNPVVLASFQISSFYPSFSSCSSLVDILSLPADDYSLNLSAASAAAQVAFAQGRGLDHDLIATHWTSIIEDGLLPFLEAASARNAHKCLRPQPDDSPLLRSIITGGVHILLSPDFPQILAITPPFIRLRLHLRMQLRSTTPTFNARVAASSFRCPTCSLYVSRVIYPLTYLFRSSFQNPGIL